MNKEELLERLNRAEWTDFEVKEARNELPKSIWETVSAFSNTSGGWIVLGVKEKRLDGKSVYEIQGVDNSEKIEQDFIGTLRSKTKFNEVISVQAASYIIQDKTVLAFYIPPAVLKPVYFNTPANTFIRTGSGDHRVTDMEFGMLMREQEFGSKSEKAVPDTGLADIYPNSLDTYRNILRVDNPLHAYSGLSDEAFCKKIGILTEHGELTVGGLLMFGKRDVINRINPNFWIDYIEIPGTTAVNAPTRYTFRLQEQENIWESYNLIVQRLRNFVDNPYSPRPDGFAPDDESRLFCLREALVNLCAHSDYFAPAHPTIRVYTDRISFQNPGAFHFDVKTVKTKHIVSNPRNPNILRFFRYAKLSENAGFGIEKILDWTTLTGLDVTFDTYSMMSDVVFYLSRRNDTANDIVNDTVNDIVKKRLLKDNELRITKLMQEQSDITLTALAESLSVSRRTVTRIVARLQKENIVSRIGSDKNGTWQVNR